MSMVGFVSVLLNLDVAVCMYSYVQLPARRLVGSSYSAGTRCAYPQTHAHAYTCTCTCRHTLINTHTAHPIPPLRGVLSQEFNGGRVASSFPPP
jgi:hypothetical protein